jgi:tRNA(Ile)-lysidine synthase
VAGASARDLRARLAEHIAEHDLFSEPGLALLAVSGGPDSIALLYVMGDLAPDLDLRLAVAHVDHGIHLDSGRWAGHVAESARRLGLPYHEVALHLGPDASETRARRERYRALRQLQRGLRARYLVTAHHADDQIETVLYRFLRGSGPAGLAGMGSVGAGGLVRPLLPFRGTELAEWLEQRAPEVTPHVDPANADQRHDRSWLRYVLMPLLRARFPDVERRIGETRAQAASERAAWETLVLEDEALQCRAIPRGVEVARGPFARYDKALSVALLRALGRVRAGSPRPHSIDCACARSTRARESGRRASP